MNEIKFTVYGEPKSKQAPGHAYIGGKVIAYTKKESRVAENNFRCQCLQYKPDKPVETPVFLFATAYKAIPKSFSKKKRQKCLELEKLRQNFLTKSDILKYMDILPITKPDCDNYLKIVCDAMKTIFFKDDSLIVIKHCEKYYSEIPRVEVTMIY